MGKTKIKTLDETVKSAAKADEASRLSEAGEVSSESTSLDVHEPDQAGSPTGEAELKKQGQPSKHKNKAQKQPKQRSKKYQEAKTLIDSSKKYSLNEAVELAQKTSYTKFPGTIEAHINTNVKGLRGLVTLPHLSGKKLTILAFPSTSSGQVAADLGENVILGSEETLTEIEKGPSATLQVNNKEVKLSEVDVIITSPDWMPKLARAAKILGPRGLMPNPKNGTITENLTKTIAELQGGKTEYKTESNGKVIHLGIGKVNQPKEEIAENIKILYNTLGRSKVQKITLSATMGPGVKVDLSSM